MSQTYTVRPGDTLFKIAQQYYGEGKLWGIISAANGKLLPESLQPGQVLTIPA